MPDLRITEDDVDALARDGRVVHIRELRSGDLPAVQALHERASDQSMYRRYFELDRNSAREYAQRLVEADELRCALGAFVAADLLGVGVLERTAEDDTAEFALLVADSAQRAGIGTLLLEHLIAAARGRGVRRCVGEVLAANGPMLQVLRDLGFAVSTSTFYGQTHVEFAIDLTAPALSAISDREQAATTASLQPLLEPRSVVVIGAGQRAGTVGHEVLRNILDGGFTGTVYAVNPKRTAVLGVPCVPSPAALPATPDLAVIALPAAAVPAAVRDCGERGIRAAVLLGAGFGEAGPSGVALQNQVLAIARAHGMRLLGPNCLGVLNTDPAIRLDATFATLSRRPGAVAVLAQSGAFGAALLTAADRVGLGVAQFVSIGNKIDIGGNDLLPAWAADPRITVIGAYLESVGDPRRFARIAQQVSRHKPVLVMKSGRTEAGQAAGRSHTAAAASSEVAIDALFRSSGVVRVRTMRELLDAARVLCDQPLLAGPRVAIVGNSGGPQILAADAAVEAGLVVAQWDALTVEALRAMGVPASNPLDLGAAVAPDIAQAAVRAVIAAPTVDAVLTVFTDIAITDTAAMSAALGAAAAATDKPVIAVSVGAPSSTRDLPATARRQPVFTFPEDAAAALGTAYRYARQRACSAVVPIRPAGLDAATARAIVDAALAEGGNWLRTEDAFRLLACYGIAACPHAVVRDPDVAATAAADLGYPLVAKLMTPGLHKTEAGGVRLGISDASALRAAVAELGGEALVQPMITGGTELIAGTVHDSQCGQLVMIGAGGVLTDVLGDRAFALAPLSEHEADDLVASLRSARLLDGYRGAPVVDRTTVRDLLVRLGALADDLPEIAELDLNPVIARADGLHLVDARIRVAVPPRHPDPLVRQLRGPRVSDGI